MTHTYACLDRFCRQRDTANGGLYQYCRVCVARVNGKCCRGNAVAITERLEDYEAQLAVTAAQTKTRVALAKPDRKMLCSTCGRRPRITGNKTCAVCLTKSLQRARRQYARGLHGCRWPQGCENRTTGKYCRHHASRVREGRRKGLPFSQIVAATRKENYARA